MRAIIILWLSFTPVYHKHDPKRPLWADRQDVFITPNGTYYEYIQWPKEHELWIGYWRKPMFKIKVYKCR